MFAQRGVDDRQAAFLSGAAERLARLRGEMEDDAEALVDASSAVAVPALLEAAPRDETDESRVWVADEEGVEATEGGLEPTVAVVAEALVADAVEEEAGAVSRHASGQNASRTLL